MQILEYHVFKKPKKLRNGKAVRRWYYYWVDETGKQFQKSCGTKVKNRQQAEDFIRTYPSRRRQLIPICRIKTMPLKGSTPCR